jgi:prophage tail gpP-like protein
MGIGDWARAIGAAAARSPVPRDGTRRHRVTITIGAEQIDGWIDYDIQCSMVEPTDGFRLTRQFSKDAWDLCQLDQKVKIAMDGVVMMEGFVDDRARSARDGTMEIAGRDKAGRLVQESIPTVSGFDGLNLVEAVKRLASPWFTTITLSDARNRSVRRGKGHRAAAGSEPAFFKVTGKLDEEHAGRLDPGETRWAVIEQLCSSIGVLCWSSADGRELVIGEPNYNQALQYLFRVSNTHGSTVKDMQYRESIASSYAMIEVHGAGAGDEDNFGDDVTTYIGTAKDGPNVDGTSLIGQGGFLFPKRLVVSQSALSSNAEAARAAEREMKRRNFKRRHLTVEAPHHGQLVAGTVSTLFAPNTLARCIDDDLELDETWLLYGINLKASRSTGETTSIMLVPRGTEFVA